MRQLNEYRLDLGTALAVRQLNQSRLDLGAALGAALWAALAAALEKANANESHRARGAAQRGSDAT